MTSTEERLRAATRAAAGTVPPGSAPPLRLLDGEPGRARWDERHRWLRAMVPLAAAAAVAAVVIASLALTRGVPTSLPGGGESAARPVPLNGVPAYYVATANQVTPTRTVLRATATGAVLATLKPPKPYGTFNFVTAAADDRTFILSAQRWWPIASGTRGLAAEKRDNTTPVVFFRLRFDPATRSTRLTALHVPQRIPASSLSGIAVSPDGSRLALALDPAQVEVVTLATGSARQWIWPGSSSGTWVGNNKPSGLPLSWTANGRTLAFPLTTESGGITSVMVLNTSSPGGSLRSAARRAVTFRGLGRVKPGPIGNALITPDGTRIITVAMRRKPSQAKIIDQAQITTFSVRTGVTVSPPPAGTLPAALTPWDVMWADPSGGTLIVDAAGLPPSAAFGVGILRGGQFTPLPGFSAYTNNVVW